MASIHYHACAECIPFHVRKKLSLLTFLKHDNYCYYICSKGRGNACFQSPLGELVVCDTDFSLSNLLSGFPQVFGVAIYAFMCHHSLPGIITPMKEKRHVFKIMGLDMIAILIVYLLLVWTAVFAFGDKANPTCASVCILFGFFNFEGTWPSMYDPVSVYSQLRFI